MQTRMQKIIVPIFLRAVFYFCNGSWPFLFARKQRARWEPAHIWRLHANQRNSQSVFLMVEHKTGSRSVPVVV